MNRFVLALLAFLAGIVAPVAPAQARLGGAGAAEIGAVETVELVSRACAQPANAATQPGCCGERRDKITGRAKPIRSRVYIPTVQLGTDRALE